MNTATMGKTDLEKISGLSDAEAARILTAEGFNELPSQKKQSGFTMLFKVLSEPMLLLLLGAGLIYLFLGEIKDALMLLTFILVVIGITFYQKRKTERTLEALRNLSSPRALVIRDGKHKRIPGREVAKGDIIVLREGDRVPADAVVLSCENFSIDESLLTGESMPVRKAEWDGKLERQRPGGDDLPFVYSGSMVVSGRGLARVNKTGIHTEIGKIGKSLETIKDEETLIHKETAKIVRTVAIVALVLCVLVVAAYAVFKGDVIQGLLSGLTLSMAMLPEEFPVVLVIFLTLGAWRISKRKVLTRRSAAIETLGAATVLCTDKTGTLTLNKMSLARLYAEGGYFKINDTAPTPLPEKFHSLLEYAILASQKDNFDPIEKEINKKGALYLKNTHHLHDNWTLLKEYPLSKKLLAQSHVWQSPDKENFIIASKGAPETIIDLCHVSAGKKTELHQIIKRMSDQGLRVLGAAKAAFSKTGLPINQHEFSFEFIGLLGFIDPPRPTAFTAVKEAYGAGMRVIVITGDYPGTAQFIAKKIGIANTDLFITGEELEKMDQLELQKKIKSVNIFARVVPEQKLLIVNALKADNEIVAMTGDGVNDAPALKSAHIGIAMGERGTDVAREASSLVLLNDDFSSIVAAVRLGRRIFDNLKKSMGYILAVHMPIAGMSIIPFIFGYPTVLLPAHIAFLELIIDPACSTVFESRKEDHGIMNRPPRNLNQPMLDRRTVFVNIMQGLGMLISVFLLFLFAVKSGRSELEARSLAFACLVLGNIMLIVINLSWEKNIIQVLLTANKTFYLIFVGALIALFAVLYIPFLAGIFYLAPLHLNDFFYIILALLISLLWLEIFKLFKNKWSLPL